jgi:hypothetical protein
MALTLPGTAYVFCRALFGQSRELPRFEKYKAVETHLLWYNTPEKHYTFTCSLAYPHDDMPGSLTAGLYDIVTTVR